MDAAWGRATFWGRVRPQRGRLGRLLKALTPILLVLAGGRFARKTWEPRNQDHHQRSADSSLLENSRLPLQPLSDQASPQFPLSLQPDPGQPGLGDQALHGLRWESGKVRLPELLDSLSDPSPHSNSISKSSHGGRGTAQHPGELVQPRPSSSPSTFYRLRGAAGHPNFGELRGQVEGPVDGDPKISPSWNLDWSTRWKNSSGLSYRPSVSVSPKEQKASLKVTKPLLFPDLKLHAETSWQRMLGTEDELGTLPHLRQAVELEAGSATQAAVANTSLPFSLVFGASLANKEPAALLSLADPADLSKGLEAKRGQWEVYARLRAPSELPRLKGWSAMAELLDPWGRGALRLAAQRPWRWRGPLSAQTPSLSPSRALLSPSSDAAAREDVDWSLVEPRWSLDHHKRYNLATRKDGGPSHLFPSSHLRLASDEGSATFRLASSADSSSEEEPGWDLDLSMRPSGWSAQGRVNVDPGSLPAALKGLGSPHYSVRAQGSWREEAKLAHEMKWASPAGDSIWMTWRPRERGRKLAAGIEVR